MAPHPERFEEFVDPVDGTRWRVDMGFLASGWTCIWGDGCQGILAEPAPDLQQGCCSVGAELLDEQEAMLITALAASIEPERFEYADRAREHGIFRDDRRDHTALVDGACIFFNRPGFEGGVDCALHLQALADGERPLDVKPAVCWQLPLKVDDGPDGGRTLRRWRRADWGDDADLAWCCTEEPDAYRSGAPTAVQLGDEIRALVGPEVAVMIGDRIDAQPSASPGAVDDADSSSGSSSPRHTIQ